MSEAESQIREPPIGGRAMGAVPESPKHAAIVAAATDLFLGAGYAATSMDAIARRANVSKRTVYSHFANKEALFAAVMASLCGRLVGPCPLGDHWTGAPDHVLSVIGTWLLTLITAPEAMALQRVVTAEAARVPALGEVFYRTGPGRMIDGVSAYLAEQTAIGVLAVPEPEPAAMQFLEMIKAPIHGPLSLGLRPQPDQAEIARSVAWAVAAFVKAYTAEGAA